MLAGESQQQAALDAGYSPAVAKNAGTKVLASEGVQVLFEDLLEEAGVSDRLLAQRIREGLDATWVKFVGDRQIERPDFEERRLMVDTVCRIRKHFGSPLEDGGLHVHFHAELESRLTRAREVAATVVNETGDSPGNRS